MKITKATAKVAAVATGLAMATSMLSLAPIAHAASLTTAQVSSILGLLSSFGADSATIANVNAALTGGTMTATTGGTTSGSSYTFSSDLTVGSTGADVTALQNFLISNGNSIPAGATGYFGSQTKAALSAYQTAKGITPAVGYFGPITRASIVAQGGSTTTTGGTTTTTTTTTPTTALTGSGRLTGVSSLGDVTSNLKESDPATAVIGVSADAIGGDVAIQRVDVTFNMNGVIGGSTNLNQYVSEISLWLGSTKLASIAPSAGDKVSGIWTYRFSGLSSVIADGTTGRLYVKVTPLTSIGTLEDGDTITAGIGTDAVRAVAGDGISDTYNTAFTQAFTVSSATTGTLTVSPATDNPGASQIAVSSSTTSGVKILSFNMKAKNSSVVITDLVASFGTTGNNLSDVVNTVYLMKGSTVLKSKTLSTGTYGTVTFNTINQTIAKDATENYTIVADLKGDAAYADGTTLTASTTVSGWDVTDGNGAAVTPSAAAVGYAQTLTATGISVSANGTPTAVASKNSYSGGLDSATFAIPFKVTAGDSAVYIGNPAAHGRLSSVSVTPSVSNGGVNYATTTNSTMGTDTASTTIPTTTLSGDAINGTTPSEDTTTAFYIPANTSRTFTFTAVTNAGSGNSVGTNVGVGIQLVGVNYGPSSTLGNTYYTSNLSSFKTPVVYVAKN